MNTAIDWKKNAFLFISSQTISLFGSSLIQYAITWFVTLTTRSGAMMTISIICGFLPAFIISPIAGVWADRYSRRSMIALADALVAVSTLILAILFLAGYDSIWLLFVISAIRAIGTGIQNPAVGAVLPQIVPADELTKINGISGSLQALTTLVSPVISGALLTIASIENIFFIDVITAAIAITTLLAFIKIPVHDKALNRKATSYFDDLRQGFEYIKNHRFIKLFFEFYVVYFILMAPVAFLTPLLIARNFGPAIWRLTANEIAFSGGMAIGGAVISLWAGLRNRIHTMALAIIVIGCSTFFIGIVPVFWIYLGCMTVIGVVMPFFNTPSTVLLQEKVEVDYLGRIFGVLVMIATSMMPLGMLVFGPISDHVKIEWLLMGTGLLLIGQGIFLMHNKTLVEGGKQAV